MHAARRCEHKPLGACCTHRVQQSERAAAGIDPSALVDAINEAQAQRAAAPAELDGAPAPTISDAEVYAMIDSLGDVGAALKDAEPDSLERLYRELGIGLRYEPHERAVDVLLAPRVVNGRVRGGT